MTKVVWELKDQAPEIDTSVADVEERGKDSETEQSGVNDNDDNGNEDHETCIVAVQRKIGNLWKNGSAKKIRKLQTTRAPHKVLFDRLPRITEEAKMANGIKFMKFGFY